MFYVLNTPEGRPTGLFDEVESFMWKESYRESGEFKLTLDFQVWNQQSKGAGAFYLSSDFTDEIMCIEDVVHRSEDGVRKTTLKGRSLDSILDRRVNITHERVTGKLIRDLGIVVRSNIGPDALSYRVWPGLTVTTSGVDPNMDFEDTQHIYGLSLLEISKKFAQFTGVGFSTKVLNGSLRVRYYTGVDRSANVIISEDLHTAQTSESGFYESESANAVYATGKTDANWANNPTAPTVVYEGFQAEDVRRRREIYVDGQSTPKEVGGNDVSLTYYRSMLMQQAMSAYRANRRFSDVVVTAEPDAIFRPKIHYNLGDYVKVVDSFGNTAKALTEAFVYEQGGYGFRVHPEFSYY